MQSRQSMQAPQSKRYAICDTRYGSQCSHDIQAIAIVVVVPLPLNVNIQKLKSVALVPYGTIAIHKKQNLKIVPYGTITIHKNKIKNCSIWNKCHALLRWITSRH